MHLTTFISTIFLILISFASAHAFSSTNVWMDNELYADMEFWAAEGLIESQLSSIKPMARSEVGRQLVTALDKCDAMKTPSATCINIQQNYTKLFAAEIEEAKNPNNTAGSFVKPIESFSLSYKYLDGPFSIFNNEGINYGRGGNAFAQFQSQARLWGVFSFFVQPALVYNNHDYRHFYKYETDLILHRGYGKINIFNFEIQAGRDSLWWGPAYHSALLMSNNAHPFDMVKLSNPEPVLLPWIFSYLGPVQFNLIFSQLHDGRKGMERANPFLYGLRLDIKPHPYLELGASHLNMFGGYNRRDLSVGEISKILYGNINPSPDSKIESNSEFGVDLALTLPNVKKYIFVAEGLKFYTEWGAEDSGFLPDKRAYLFGLAIFNPFGLARAAFRGEYARISPESMPNAWYTHRSYPMRYNGRVFGHHAGTDSEDIFVEWSHNIEKFSYKLSYDRERSGVQSQIYTQSKNQYSGELGFRFNENIKVTLQYAYEKIKNLGYVYNQRQKNHLLGMTLTLNF
ncbi:MAG: hypothetical protein JW976_10350 [Syntrophaceae bacterium]|nr:hypothetical protein [Syntrophaceae bacterium]